MRVLIDTSIVLRALLGQPGRYEGWGTWERAYASVLGTLDALHLATLLAVQHDTRQPLVLLTHDDQLARAARACGLDVLPA